MTCNGWHDAGPKTVLKEAQDRVAKDGWEGKPDEKGLPRGGARKAISNQVRYVGIPRLNCIACLRALCSFRVWILRAFLLDGIWGDSKAAETLYHDTLDFLEEGRKMWESIPSEDRGAVFDDTFVRGVRVLHLSTFKSVRMPCTSHAHLMN